LVIMGASNVRPTLTKGRKTYVYVRITSLHSCSSMRLMTYPKEWVSPSSNVVWNEGCCLEAELSVKGLRLELMSYTADAHDAGKVGLLRKLWKKTTSSTRKSKCLGHVVINWEQDILGPTAGLYFTQSVPLRPEIVEDIKSFAEDTNIPHLQLSVSTSTPTSAPFILRMLASLEADATIKEGGKMTQKSHRETKGCWMPYSILDHTGRKQFLIWARHVCTICNINAVLG
jgi:hypothetical protein